MSVQVENQEILIQPWLRRAISKRRAGADRIIEGSTGRGTGIWSVIRTVLIEVVGTAV